MYREVIKVKNPHYVVITPLKMGDKISKITKKTVKRNKKYGFDWISFEGDNNIPTNTTEAISAYLNKHKPPKYIIKIDNDIEMDNGLLDLMYEQISNSEEHLSYVYCDFYYYLPDKRKIEFQYEFNKQKLLDSNYISSNSMIKFEKLVEIGGFICDSKYERLLDWALWLEFLKEGYIGERVRGKSFKTPLNKNNISARSADDYKLKYKNVYEDFIKPIMQKKNSIV